MAGLNKQETLISCIKEISIKPRFNWLQDAEKSRLIVSGYCLTIVREGEEVLSISVYALTVEMYSSAIVAITYYAHVTYTHDQHITFDP